MYAKAFSRSGTIFLFGLVMWVTVLMVLSGCASGTRHSKAEIEYGNPFIDHVKNLPINKISPESVGIPGTPALPEMNSTDYERLGDALLDRGEFYTAYLQYQRALNLNPESPRLSYKTGLTFLAAGKYKDAVKEFQKALVHDDAYALAYEGLGEAHFQMKNFKEGETCFRKALELDHGLWKSHSFMGNILDYNGQHGQAASEYQSAISIRPDKAYLYNNLGVCCNLNREFENAVLAFQMALKAGYRTNKIYNNLGLALANLGQYPAALDAFQKGGTAAQAYNNLGCIYMQQGNRGKASKCFQKAIEIDPIFYVKAGDNLKKSQSNPIDLNLKNF